MSKNITTLVILVAFATLVFSGTVSARHGGHKKGEVINDTCPVTGGKVDKDTGPEECKARNHAMKECKRAGMNNKCPMTN